MTVETILEGANFRVEVDEGVVVARVWKRPDLMREEGAQAALAMGDALESLATMPRAYVHGAMFDAREAPPTFGPTTEKMLQQAVGAWERVGRRFAVVIGPEPVQKLQLGRLLATVAPTCGKLFADPIDARTWIGRRMPTRIPPR